MDRISRAVAALKAYRALTDDPGADDFTLSADLCTDLAHLVDAAGDERKGDTMLLIAGMSHEEESDCDEDPRADRRSAMIDETNRRDAALRASRASRSEDGEPGYVE